MEASTFVGEVVVVPASGDRRVLVQSSMICGSGTGNYTYQDGLGGVSISGTLVFAGARTPQVGFADEGYFSTTPGNALTVLVSGAGASIAGFIDYEYV